jgi:hypothetical protein
LEDIDDDVVVFLLAFAGLGAIGWSTVVKCSGALKCIGCGAGVFQLSSGVFWLFCIVSTEESEWAPVSYVGK